jgi:HTH-type transcriptional regulator / antitoxin HipB
LTDLASTVQQRRKELRLTQEDLADLSGCSSRFVRSVEAGKTSIRLDKLDAILAALGLELTAQRRRTDGE